MWKCKTTRMNRDMDSDITCEACTKNRMDLLSSSSISSEWITTEDEERYEDEEVTSLVMGLVPKGYPVIRLFPKQIHDIREIIEETIVLEAGNWFRARKIIERGGILKIGALNVESWNWLSTRFNKKTMVGIQVLLKEYKDLCPGFLVKMVVRNTKICMFTILVLISEQYEVFRSLDWINVGKEHITENETTLLVVIRKEEVIELQRRGLKLVLYGRVIEVRFVPCTIE